jgi:hypothetical protein
MWPIDIPDSCRPVLLEEMDSVALTNRIDSKFVFPEQVLDDLLIRLSSRYRVLEIDKHKVHHYDTVYFDDVGWSLYLDHHNQRGNRFKLRARRYGSSSVCFLEVKRKTVKGRTVKSRMRIPALPDELNAEHLQFLRRETGSTGSPLRKAISIAFDRITLVSLDPPERLTLDVNLSFSNSNTQKPLPGIVIAELKQGGKATSFFLEQMKEMYIQPFSVSKYCLAVSLLESGIKSNTFKPQLLRLNRIQNLTRNYGT